MIVLILMLFGIAPNHTIGALQTAAEPEQLADLGYAPNAPRYSDYPVRSEQEGPGTRLSVGRCDAADAPGGIGYLGHIRAEARENGPNFAGRCVVVVCSCGSDCGNLSVVDIKTGYVYSFPFTLSADMQCTRARMRYRDHITFRPDSSLLIVVGDLTSYDESAGLIERRHGCAVRYYRWTGRRLVLLRKVPVHP
jgi:hypothetical protein